MNGKENRKKLQLTLLNVQEKNHVLELQFLVLDDYNMKISEVKQINQVSVNRTIRGIHAKSVMSGKENMSARYAQMKLITPQFFLNFTYLPIQQFSFWQNLLLKVQKKLKDIIQYFQRYSSTTFKQQFQHQAFEFKLPSELLSLFSFQEDLGNTSNSFFSFDCQMQIQNKENEDVFFIKIVITALLLLFVLISSILFWIVVSLIKGNLNPMKIQFVTTIVVLIFTLHPTIQKGLLSLFSCMYIDDNLLITFDTEGQCQTKEYKKFIFFVGIPGLIL